MSKLKNVRPVLVAVAALTLVAGLGGAVFASSERDGDTDRRADRSVIEDKHSGTSPVLAIEDVLARVKAEGYSNIREVELERGRYEIEGRDAEGHRVELYVDARTGEVIKVERDD